MRLAGATTVSQLTMTLYLLTESQRKLCSPTTRHASTASFTDVLDWIADAEKIVPKDNLFDLLTLKLTQRKAITYITKLLTDDRFCSENAAFTHRFFNRLIKSVVSIIANLTHRA